MIGTDALNADGVTQSGRRVQLVADGTWQLRMRDPGGMP